MTATVELLQAIRWIAQAGENVSESTNKKCFINAGYLLEDESLVSFPEEHQEFDPCQELADSEMVQVNSLLMQDFKFSQLLNGDYMPSYPKTFRKRDRT